MSMSVDKLCEILKGHSEGKTIEAKCFDGKFRTTTPGKYLLSELLDMELRIKPEPREVWVLVYRDDSMHVLSSRSEAEEWAAESTVGYTPEIIHYREVLENE